MTRDEHQAQEVVAHFVVDRLYELRLRAPLPGLEFGPELLVLALGELAVAQVVDRPMLRGGHEPGARVVRDTRLRPPLQRGDQGILRQVLRDAHIAHDPHQSRDEAGRLDPPDRIDREMWVRRHGARNSTGRTSHSPSNPGQCRRCSSRKSTMICFAASREGASSIA